MKNFETYVIFLLLVILGVMLYMAYRQHDQIVKAERQIDKIYNTFEKWVPLFNKIAKAFGG